MIPALSLRELTMRRVFHLAWPALIVVLLVRAWLLEQVGWLELYAESKGRLFGWNCSWESLPFWRWLGWVS
jgi:hypothetical protein